MIFGTDGIRGRFGVAPMDKSTIGKLSSVLRGWLPEGALVLLGSDTRSSGREIRNWITGNLGTVKVLDLGVAPTPVVAFETRAREAHLGIMTTASHNPAHDNGLKFFDSRGLKIGKEVARLWSDRLTRENMGSGKEPAPPLPCTPDHYRAFLLDHFEKDDFKGLRIGFDTAHGATSNLVKELSWDLGLDAVFTGDRPDGENINAAVGAMYPKHINQLVIRHDLDVGFAFDGDGDRLVVSDTEILHGDRLLYALFKVMAAEGKSLDSLVGTIMCGMGLEQTLNKEGVRLIRTKVGDRNVLVRMLEENLSLGGETSGHIIQGDLFPAGDGFLAALRLARAMARNSDLLQQARAAVPLFPYFEKAYPVARKPPLVSVENLWSFITRLEEAMKGSGRLIIRYSGTEPKLRVFLEASDLAPFREAITELETLIGKELG